jgi:hypothetical protein
MRALDLDNAHPDDSPERRDHVVRRGGCAEHRQNLGDEELALVLGITGAPIGDDDDAIAGIGAGASCRFPDVIRPYTHQHQRIHVSGAQHVRQMRPVERIDTMFIDDQIPAWGVSSSQMAAPGEPAFITPLAFSS